MAKSQYERLIEKQTKEAQKQAKLQQLRDRASAIISGAKFVNGFRIMDDSAEKILSIILEKYAQMEEKNKEINLLYEDIPDEYQYSIDLELEKLQMYGVISSYINFIGNSRIYLSDVGINYFNNKIEAIEQEKNDAEQIERTTTRKTYDVFLSHAAKDKSEYVDSLYVTLRRLGINVFYDTDVISWGDKWKDVIINGTETSEFAIIVVSNNFFGREWTERELTEFLSRQNDNGQKIVLPLLLNITLEDLKKYYPELGDIQCISANNCSKEDIAILLAKELIKRYR